MNIHKRIVVLHTQIKNLLMKIITSLLKKLTVTLSLITIFSCSLEPLESNQSSNNALQNQQNLTCVDAQPEARFVNNGSISYEFKIFTTAGQIVEFVNVAPGTTTNWTSFAEGDILFSINSNTTGVSDIKTQVFMANCETYELEVLPNNTLATNSPISN